MAPVLFFCRAPSPLIAAGTGGTCPTCCRPRCCSGNPRRRTVSAPAGPAWAAVWSSAVPPAPTARRSRTSQLAPPGKCPRPQPPHILGSLHAVSFGGWWVWPYRLSPRQFCPSAWPLRSISAAISGKCTRRQGLQMPWLSGIFAGPASPPHHPQICRYSVSAGIRVARWGWPRLRSQSSTMLPSRERRGPAPRRRRETPWLQAPGHRPPPTF